MTRATVLVPDLSSDSGDTYCFSNGGPQFERTYHKDLWTVSLRFMYVVHGMIPRPSTRVCANSGSIHRTYMWGLFSYSAEVCGLHWLSRHAGGAYAPRRNSETTGVQVQLGTTATLTPVLKVYNVTVSHTHRRPGFHQRPFSGRRTGATATDPPDDRPDWGSWGSISIQNRLRTVLRHGSRSESADHGRGNHQLSQFLETVN